ncbi:uncharacterized protein [Ptychodera flava]|uniref:uncharacterized protein n=1 Tax=Ptychodera flava TaxID=63121 RepID=UPI00396A8693
MAKHSPIFSREDVTKLFIVLCFFSFFAVFALYQYGYVSKPLSLITYNLRPIARTRANGTNINRTAASRYFMPVLMFLKSGPQHNYIRFRDALPLVALQNRTLVAYPIRNHKTQDNASEARNLSVTFDIELLKQFVPVVTPYEFFRQCNGSAVVMNQRIRSKRGNLLKEIYRDTGLLFQEIKHNKENSAAKSTFARRLSSLWEYPCIIYQPRSTPYYNFTLQWKKTAKEAYRYLKKAPYLRSMGEEGARHICEGKKYLALHWRNRSGEWCTSGRKQFCNFTRLNLVSESPQLVKAFQNFMKLKNISCVYLAFPPFAKKMYDILRPHIPQLYTKEDLIKTVPSIAAYKNDNFVISLVEQEIVKRADKFIGCSQSAWTQFAKFERADMNRRTMSLRAVKGMPKGVLAIN